MSCHQSQYNKKIQLNIIKVVKLQSENSLLKIILKNIENSLKK